MGLLDDTAIFAAVVEEGGFSRAANKLGLSNGLVSRRVAKLEETLGVTLLKRTTRQSQLTPEGELFWQHVKRMQQELDTALCLIRSSSDKPHGGIRLSAPSYFGRHYLLPIINEFMRNFQDIRVDLLLTDEYLDPIKENIDLLIRGSGYFEKNLKDSSMKVTLLMKTDIQLYAAPEYLLTAGIPKTPADLLKHAMIGYVTRHREDITETWQYRQKNKSQQITFTPKFRTNDIDARLQACLSGHGIGKFTQYVHLNKQEPVLQRVLEDYDWGIFQIYAAYSQQQALPRRTRVLLDFIISQLK